jgi:hypothetical protein
MTRDSMVFYRSFFEAVEDLPPEDFKQAVTAIMRYALDGTADDVKGVAKSILIMARPQIDKNNKRYENGTRGGRKPNDNQTITKTEPKCISSKPNVNVNDNVNDIKENTLKSVKEKRFAPPTPEDVREYCREKGLNVDADRFVDFYESKNWYVGKNKMKDWKAAVRNWARSQSQRQESTAKGTEKPRNRFDNFQQREYDYDALIAREMASRSGT